MQRPALIANNILQFSRHAERALFYNRCFYSCANSTMEKALRSRILIISDLSLDMYLKNIPNHASQAFGHLDTIRQGLRSTKKPPRKRSSRSPSQLHLSEG